MTRIQLRTYILPGGADVFIKVKRKDGEDERMTAFVDTGAEACLLPLSFINELDCRLTERGTFMADQAGIAGQAFQATEGIVKLSLEDQYGAESEVIEVRVWFADTDIALIGYEGILDRAVLHIDMLNTRTGWIEI